MRAKRAIGCLAKNALRRASLAQGRLQAHSHGAPRSLAAQNRLARDDNHGPDVCDYLTFALVSSGFHLGPVDDRVVGSKEEIVGV
jgi:hypothetical protein